MPSIAVCMTVNAPLGPDRLPVFQCRALPATATRPNGEGIVRGVRLGLAVCGRRCSVSGVLAGLRFKQIPDAREIDAAIAFGEESVMTDAVEAVGQDMHEETPDELMRGEAHDAGTSAAAVVPVGANSDEAARLKRDDCAQGFLDDAAPL
jgi:hypothetical protein